MTSKRHLFLSSIQKDLSTKFPVCQVCGDRARIINYGALSCSSCKTFFRRRGFNFQVEPSLFYLLMMLFFYRLFPNVCFMETVR